MRHAAQRGAGIVTLALSFVLGYACEAISSPSKAHWIRETLIGASESHYYVLVSERDYPGNYYQWSEKLSLRKLGGSDLLEAESFVLHEVFHQKDAESTSSDWQTSSREQPRFDLSSYLHENGVRTVFSQLHPFEIVVKDRGLYAHRGEPAIPLLSQEELARQIPDLGSDPSVVISLEAESLNSATGPGMWFFAVRYNEDSTDDSWSERLVAVPTTRLRDAFEALRELLKK